MSEAICTCHCGGAMFYRHLHAESCVLSREGEEAPKSELQTLRDERDRLRKALRPFAEVGDALDTREFINLYERWGTSGKRHVISMQHLKHAAAVYGATK